ncbi:MAG: hypothetical protein ABT08_11480 [Microbacterium sp. SCN 71-21]|nr:MAG: hypothetical protein ABT08_11480 [Microbacterium sp. SCN 71-21]
MAAALRSSRALISRSCTTRWEMTSAVNTAKIVPSTVTSSVTSAFSASCSPWLASVTTTASAAKVT